MQKIQYKCDHCGKEIDDFNDYTDLEIELASFHKCVDLCTDCYNKLSKTVDEFTTLKKEGFQWSLNLVITKSVRVNF